MNLKAVALQQLFVLFRPVNRSLKLERDWYIVGEGLAPPAPLKELRGKSNGNNVCFELLRLQREQQATPLRQSLAQSYVCASNFVFIVCRWAGRWRASAPTVIICSFITPILFFLFEVFWECRGLFYKKVLCIVLLILRFFGVLIKITQKFSKNVLTAFVDSAIIHNNKSQKGS